jgi:hypothetical protein
MQTISAGERCAYLHSSSERRPMVSSRQRHVLEMLADASERGRADDAFLSRFTSELLDLVGKEFATVEREVKKVRGWPVEVARIRITDAGRTVIEKCVSLSRYERVHPKRQAETIAA